MENISHQGFDEWFWKIVDRVYLPHLHNIVGNMLPNKMVDKRHGSLVHGDTKIRHVQHHTHVVHKYRCGFGYLDPHWYKVVPEHNILLEIILQCCEIGSKWWYLYHSTEFWWPCCGSLSYQWKLTCDQNTSNLVVTMSSIHKHINIQLIK